MGELTEMNPVMVIERNGIRWMSATGKQHHPPPERWDFLLRSGQYEHLEADSPYGPYTPSETRDDGSIIVAKRYGRLRKTPA